MRSVSLASITTVLESGSRPRSGMTDAIEVPSIGGEQINADGSIRADKLRFITFEAFDKIRAGKLKKGDILIVKDGATTGKTAFYNADLPYKKIALNEHVFRLEVNDSVAESKFVYWFLRSKRGQGEIAKDFRGSTVGGISRGFVKKVEIPLPPLTEQQRIARILDAADALRVKRRQTLSLLETFLQSVFLDLFGDPVLNPKGWEVVKIGDLLESANYGTSKKADLKNGAYPVLRMNNITYTGEWDFSSLKYIDLNEKELSKHLVHKGQILFNRTNSKELVGKTAVFREETPMAFAGYLVRGIPNKEADPEYIAAYMNTPQTKQRLMHMCKNIVGMANINAKEFQKIPIQKPPLDLQRRFAAIVAAVERQKAAMRAHLTELEQLFGALQQRAFNGELGTGNGELGTGNGERGTGNGERGTRNGELGMKKGRREHVSGFEETDV